ncbi:hypothetical protein [Actinomadura rupiterrae]|nr:hypothetical protein [Actinomadura rupiterrae]MCP2341148.1 hypothetical protein [Actinomadura rupiterrae]
MTDHHPDDVPPADTVRTTIRIRTPADVVAVVPYLWATTPTTAWSC